MNFKKTTAFTLVELLIVVIIVGILAGIVIPNYSRVMERSKCTQAMETLKHMRKAALMFFNENQTFVGMDAASLEAQVNADFDTNDNNKDWNFVVSATGATNFTLQATRTAPVGHPNANLTITIDQNGIWAGTYDINDPVSTF